MEENHWFTDRCAKAFWDQREGAPYKRLVSDTIEWAAPKKGERWLDLGCGGGQLSAALWIASSGPLEELVCLDCAAANALPVARLAAKHARDGNPSLFRFVHGDFSHGLRAFATDHFDGIVSGLSISYAESRDPNTGNYNDEAFRRVLSEARRVLSPTGRFVFSINVPEPNFWKVLWQSLGRGLRISKPGRQLTNALKMQWYGRWLRKEARRGRFHYLPIEQLEARLTDAGFGQIEHRLSYADQAYVVRARFAQSAELPFRHSA